MKTLFDHIPAFECNEIRVTGHAIQRMTERGILYDQVLETVFWERSLQNIQRISRFPVSLFCILLKEKQFML